MNCPGVAERPNCIIEYNPRTQMLQVRSTRIIVPGEEFVISYGSKYHFMGERVRTSNQQVRRRYKLRGKRNENIKDLQLNPPLHSEEETETEAEEEEEEYEDEDFDTDDEPIWEKSNVDESTSVEQARQIVQTLQVIGKSLLDVVRSVLLELQKLDDILVEKVCGKRKTIFLAEESSLESEHWEP